MVDNERLTYDVGTAARLLGLSRGSAYQACLTGEIPHIKVGRRILIPCKSLEEFLASAGKPKIQLEKLLQDNRNETSKL